MKILNLIGVSSIFLLFIFRESEHQNIGAATLENIHRCVASECLYILTVLRMGAGPCGDRDCNRQWSQRPEWTFSGEGRCLYCNFYKKSTYYHLIMDGKASSFLPPSYFAYCVVKAVELCSRYPA